MNRLLALLCLATWPLGASAQLSQRALTDKEIIDFVYGKTIGVVDQNHFDSSLEYHGEDGTAIWVNGGQVKVGVYRVKNDQLCYSYADRDYAWWSCWDISQDRRTGEIFQRAPSGNTYNLFVAGHGNLTGHPSVSQ